MSNIINSPNINNTNPITAKNISETSVPARNIGVVEAPQQLPKYSINKVLQEKDEFRKNVLYSNYQSAKKKSILPKIGVILAAVFGFLILKRKK